MADVVKLLDFGLVKYVGAAAQPGVTSTDTIIGTPLYMSPESIRAPESVDARSDLYALGAVGYFLLSGTPVFQGQGAIEVCGHHLHTTPEPPSRRSGRPIAADLERVLMDCLAKDPARRPHSADELARRLRACADADRWTESDAERCWQGQTATLDAAA